MSMPSISIIVPVYNVEAYIRQCMDSLVHQTLRDIEIICIDDCGSDDSMRIVEEYATEDERVAILRHDNNRGLSAARNTGISAARAPYIMFCDSDDYYAPLMCERMLSAIKSSEDVDLAVCGTSMIYECNEDMEESDRNYYAVKYAGSIEASEAVFERCDVAAWNKIYKRSMILERDIRFPEGLKFEDAYFFNVYAVNTRKIFFIKELLYYYRRRPGSIMNATISGRSSFNLDHLRVGISIYRYLKTHHKIEKFLHYFGKLYFNLVQCAVRYSSGEKAEVSSVFDYAESLLAEEQVDFSAYSDLEYTRRLVKDKVRPGHVKKKFWGLIRIKYKYQSMKYYFCGIPIRKIKFDRPLNI